jgi:lysophospholipase L1-like esterase
MERTRRHRTLSEGLRYLALGDSYTIGTGATDAARSWPAIITSRLASESRRDVVLTNPAVNGFTTLDLIKRELPLVALWKPDFVTVLIGVNDLVRGRTPDQYRESLIKIYDEVRSLRLATGRAAAVSIPTWSYVPAAADYGGSDQVERLTRMFNAVAEKEARSHGLTWIDITEASTSGAGTPDWIASDELHPGDAQYAAWADAIWRALSDSWVAVS